MTVYRPSAIVKLTIRTEEFEATQQLESRLPEEFSPEAALIPAVAPPSSTGVPSDTAAAQIEANQERRRALEQRRGSISQEQYETELMQITFELQDIFESQRITEGDASDAPQTVAGSTTDELTVLGQISPQSLNIQRYGPSTANTANVTISYYDMPIDPRIIRACGIELILGVVPAEDYETGITTGGTRLDGSLLSTPAAPNDGTLQGATRFVGFVDRWTVDYDSEGGDSITLECRDASAPLRDLKLPTGASIDLSQPLDAGLRSFLNAVSATTRNLNVVWEAEGEPSIPGNSGPTRRRPRRGTLQRRTRRGGEDMSIWDHITDVVRSQGFIPLIRGWDIVIIDPRTLYSSTGATTMVYGRNLSKLSFTRDLQGVKVPTIEVRCYDSERGRTLWARYPVATGQPASGVFGTVQPPRPSRANQVPPSGSNPDESVRVMLVSGITDSAVLERIARGIFEEIGRQEISGKFETDDAWSYYLTPEEADLLTLEAGDSVELLIARATSTEDELFGSATTLAEIQAMDTARRTDFMTNLGWDQNVAFQFASLQEATGFQTTFRTSGVRLGFDNDQGLKVAVDFINYIVIREE